MNRRGFISSLAGLTPFLILPSARTYERVWRSISETSLPCGGILIIRNGLSGEWTWLSVDEDGRFSQVAKYEHRYLLGS